MPEEVERRCEVAGRDVRGSWSRQLHSKTIVPMKIPKEISKILGEFIVGSGFMNNFFELIHLNYQIKIYVLYVIYFILLFHIVAKHGESIK